MSAGATVAFYAYASGTFSRPSDHFILHFDTVITNAGNGYHPHSGVFIAPRSGYYVFTWSFRIQNSAHISTELMVNGSSKGSVFSDTENGVGGNHAGTIVVYINEGDEVFLRTTKFLAKIGDIYSDFVGRTYFAGWLMTL